MSKEDKLKTEINELKIFIKWIAEALELDDIHSLEIGDFYEKITILRKQQL